MNFTFQIIIPVKGSSIRVENKNSLPFGNKPTMLEWKLSQLLEVFNPKQILITTDHDLFKEVAIKHGTLLHERKNPILSDEAHINYKFSRLVHEVVSNVSAHHIAWLPITSPLMSGTEYQNCFKLYEQNVVGSNKYDSLITVNSQQEYLWNNQSPINYSLNNHIPSQKLPVWYKVTNGFFVLPNKVAMEKSYIVGSNPFKAEVSKLAGFDIDTEEDYEICQALYPLYLKHHSK